MAAKKVSNTHLYQFSKFTSFSTIITDVVTGVFATFFHPSHWIVPSFPATISFIQLSTFSTSRSKNRPASEHRLGTQTPGIHFSRKIHISGLSAAFQAIPHATNSLHKSSENSIYPALSHALSEFCSLPFQGSMRTTNLHKWLRCSRRTKGASSSSEWCVSHIWSGRLVFPLLLKVPLHLGKGLCQDKIALL